MAFLKWAEKRAKKMKWYDFSILKLTMLAFGLWLATIWPALLGVNPWIYFAVFIVGWLYLLILMFK